MEVLLGTVLYFGLGIPLTILHGYVLSVLWGWFVVPLGAPAISIPIAIGLSTILSFQFAAVKKEDGGHEGVIEKMVFQLVCSLFVSIFILGYGWVVHQYV